MVRYPIQSDHRPVFKFKWRKPAELILSLWKVTNYKSTPTTPKVFIFSKLAPVPQSFTNYTAGRGRDVDADPLPPGFFGGF